MFINSSKLDTSAIPTFKPDGYSLSIADVHTETFSQNILIKLSSYSGCARPKPDLLPNTNRNLSSLGDSLTVSAHDSSEL
jgi:hypothetical protein